METLYDWLLHNTGNAGNYYTILNTERDESGDLDVMVRSSDFKVMNLFIHDTKSSNYSENQSDGSADKSSENRYIFSNEQQVIAYLADGKTPESQIPDSEKGIRVLVAEPDGEAGNITFPPAQM